MDVTDRESVRALVTRAEEKFEPVEVLVNCAGVMYYTLMANLREDEWERTVRVNCEGVLNCVGAVLPRGCSCGEGEHIVTISSDAGRKVSPSLAVYSASKSFVEALSQGLRLGTASMGVKVTTVQPGNVATGLLDAGTDEEALERYTQPNGVPRPEPHLAASVVWALTRPDPVAVNEILLEPRDEPA